jgi:hypothetical protein
VNANIELALITQVIDTEDFKTLEKMKIDESFFSSPEAQEAYRFIRDIYRNPDTVGNTPTRELLNFHYPTFRFHATNDAVSVLCQQLRTLKVKLEVELLAQTLMEEANTNPIAALATLRAESARIGSLSETSADFSLAGAAHTLREEYEAIASAGGVTGIPFPWEALNEETQGMHPGDFIVLYGRPKSMKTWVALFIAMCAYIISRKRVLIYSREMSPKKLLKRLACLLAKVDYKKFTTGKLNPVEKERVFSILTDLIEDEKAAGARGLNQPFIMVVADAGGSRDVGGVSWLKSKIEEFKPDLVLVDGMYLMADDRTKSRTIDWKNVTHISQDLKIAATSYEVPIIGVTQANRGADKAKGEDLTEIAFADSLGMDADAILRVSKHEYLEGGTGRKKNKLFITSPGLREGIFEGIVINGQPGFDFTFISTIQSEEAKKAVQDEDSSYKEAGQRLVQSKQFRKDGTAKDPRF